TFACRRSGAAEYWRRSSVATGPIQSDVELGDTDRSEIPDRNRKPSSAPALKPRLTGTTALPPSKRSPNDLIRPGSVRPAAGPRRVRCRPGRVRRGRGPGLRRRRGRGRVRRWRGRWGRRATHRRRHRLVIRRGLAQGVSRKRDEARAQDAGEYQKTQAGLGHFEDTLSGPPSAENASRRSARRPRGLGALALGRQPWE